METDLKFVMELQKMVRVFMDDTGRECISCHQFKSWDHYYKHSLGANGRTANCKQCRSASAKAKRVYATKPYRDDLGKTCPVCKTYKPFSEFVKDKSGPDGYASGCKPCRYARTKKWAEANPEAVKAGVKDWIDRNHEHVKDEARKFAKAKRERLGSKGWCEAMKQYRKDNYDKVRSRELANERKHREVRNYRLKEDRRAKPHRYAAYDARKHHRRSLRLVPWANQDAIAAVYARAQFLTASTGVEHHVDHIYPLLGRTVSGLHVVENLQVLTKIENIRKGNRLSPEYLPDDVQAELAL